MDDDKGSKVIKSRDTGIRRNLGRKDKIRKPPPNHSILCDRSNSTRQHSQLYSFKILIILVLIIYISMSLGRFFFFFFFRITLTLSTYLRSGPASDRTYMYSDTFFSLDVRFLTT